MPRPKTWLQNQSHQADKEGGIMEYTMLACGIIGLNIILAWLICDLSNKEIIQKMQKITESENHLKKCILDLNKQIEELEYVINTIQTGIQSGDNISITNANDQQYDFLIKKLTQEQK